MSGKFAAASNKTHRYVAHSVWDTLTTAAETQQLISNSPPKGTDPYGN
jgi:hypothetical protein